MSTFTTPPTVEAVTQKLGTLGGRDTQWEKAALVAVLVGPNHGRGKSGSRARRWPYSTDSLAELGVPTLRSGDTVRRYRDTWFAYHDDAPELGGVVTLPGIPFPETAVAAKKRRREQIGREAEAAQRQAELVATLEAFNFAETA